jgi:hypothetical protein
MQNGKGSKPRPFSDYNNFQDNWNQINWTQQNDLNDKKIKNDIEKPTQEDIIHNTKENEKVFSKNN